MKFVRCFAMVLLFVFAAAGCGKRESTRVLEPPPPEPPPSGVAEAQWVTDKGALGDAVRAAAASPLVQHAVRSLSHPRLTPVHHLAARAIGRSRDGMNVSVTILPYMVDGDSKHATFVSLIEGGAGQVVDIGELIVGRAPTSLETGFVPINLGGKVAWVKGVSAYAAGAGGKASLSPVKRKWAKFIQCVLETALAGCAAGSSFADEIAPGVPRARAIGCGIGAGVAVLGCALEHLT